MLENLESSIVKGHQKKVKSILRELIDAKDKSCTGHLFRLLNSNIKDGIIICDLARTFFRLNRESLSDCSTIFMFQDNENVNIIEALLEVLGYDKMIPSVEDQKRIIEKFFRFGDGMDMRYFSDPRYGLAAACAGWDNDVVREFLLYCKTVGDAPLKYVSENSLKRKYVRLRSLG
jgi:hypothetical protein